MQLKTLQIVWHGKEPVLSVDFQPNTHTLASGGQDGEVKHWEVVAEEDGSPGVRFLSSYPVNSKAVNCVRFSPGGDMLASAGDKGEVLLWRFSAFTAGAQPLLQPQQPQQQRGPLDGADAGAGAPASSGSSATAAASGMWRQVGLLRGHCDDVLDLAWAPDGSALLSGGIENNCILWDVEGRKSLKWLQDHGHYVQGVAWDPLGRYIVSQSADRTARVYAVKPPPGAADGGVKRATVAPAAPSVVTSASLARDGFYAAATLSKGPLLLLGLQHQQPETATGGAEGEMAPRGGGGSDAVAADAQQLQLGQEGAAAAPGASGGVAKQPLFCDDSLPTFFRRLAWSPDGAFLAMPAGMYRAGISAPVTSTTHIFSRGDWSGPALSLPCLSKGALVVRFCPRLFRAPQPPESTGAAGGAAASLLTYRIMMAVASVDSVVLYDMQALEPLAVLGGIHFAAVTDLAWSDDGRYLVVASRDGYCTVCSFEEGELGEPVPLEELPAGVAAAVSRAAARRYQERTAAAAALKAVAAAATTAPVAAPPDSVTDELLEAPELVVASGAMAAGTSEAPINAAGPRRIQPIPVACVGSDADVARTGPGNAADCDTATAASVKRPADGEPLILGGAGGRPKPKRIQPIPLSATALATALPAAAAVIGVSCPGRSSSGGLATSSAPPAAAPVVTATVMAAAASPGRRRIVPTRVDGMSGIGHAGSVAAAAAPAPAGGRSPFLAATPMPVSDIAMAPARTPVLAGVCGADSMIVPGVAAPGSAVKMPTPQVLVFGTPPSSAPRHRGGDGHGTGTLVSEHRHLAAFASQQPQSQPKPKRVTPVPVDRGNRSILVGNALPVALPLPPPAVMALAQPPNQQGQVTRAGEGPPQPQPAQTECQNAQVTVTCATLGHGTAVGSSDVGAGSDNDAGEAAPAGGSSPDSGAVAGGADGGGGGGGPRFSVAQLAATRGAAAARKAAEGAL
ncbi:hypothetical protein VaNZ11_016228 [Volvox africanus]|uniref:CAF1B/HIR1 beta-propeller domain-containing protein n=1 Tax=Volvox africanus TaxID=51714 RepID=A0ABQ5SME7_9CHLO|nr:hypothetical protein VaNZ11_016228 [Volvox africanus]